MKKLIVIATAVMFLVSVGMQENIPAKRLSRNLPPRRSRAIL